MPPPLPFPQIHGEITPSPPISPSPAPTTKNRVYMSRVNQILDLSTPVPPTPPNASRTLPSMAMHIPANMPPSVQPPNNKWAAPGSDTDAPSKDTLPQFNQVTQATNLHILANPRCLINHDPLDKYTKGVTTEIHDAHPDSAYVDFDPKTIEEWRTLPGKKLLAIPFESNAQLPHLHYVICNRIFNTVGEITNSKSQGVASPVLNKENQNTAPQQVQYWDQDQDKDQEEEQLPSTFLIYNLSKTHYKILTQQTIWASQSITFRVTTPPIKCPSFLFAIKGLQAMDSILVQDYIYKIWHDENTALYFQEAILTMEEDSCTIAYQAILSFLESIWIDCLEMKGLGGAVQPTFNVFTDGSIIDNNHTWSNIRTYLANRSYHSSRLGQGRVVIAPNHCGLCHSADLSWTKSTPSRNPVQTPTSPTRTSPKPSYSQVTI